MLAYRAGCRRTRREGAAGDSPFVSGPEISRIGVESQNKLGLALDDPGNQVIAEGSSVVQRLFTALFRPLPAVKRGTREAAI